MGALDKRLLLDVEGEPIPQRWDESLQEYVPWTDESVEKLQLLLSQLDLPLSDFRDALRGGSAKTLTDLDIALSELKTLIGEVKASPTENTVLARLKALEGHVDGLESLLTSIKDTDGIRKIGTAVDVSDRAGRVVGKTGIQVDGSDVTVENAIPVKAGTGASFHVSIQHDLDTMINAPVTGIKTVTATAAEIFAGASGKAQRRKLILKNEDPILRFRVIPSTGNQQNGFPIEPGAAIVISFDPAVDAPVYAISEGASLEVAVMEI